MGDKRAKNGAKPPGTPPAVYSQELPETQQETARAMPEFAHPDATKQKGPGPRDAATPYGGGTINGTNDSSRFSTPPPRKS